MQKTATYDEVVPHDLAPPVGILVSGYYHCSFGYRARRPRGAGSWLLFYTVAGQGLLQQPGVERRVGAGDVDLLAPDAYSDYGVPPPRGKRRERFLGERFIHHLVRPSWGSADQRPAAPRGGWKFHWIHFQPGGDWQEMLDWPRAGEGWGHGHIASPRTRRDLERAFTRVHQDLLTAGEVAQQLARTALEEVLLRIVHEIGQGRRKLDPRIADALAIMRTDPAAGRTVASLARAVALSPSRFSHLFKQQTGDSVKQTLITMRIRQAQRLLAFTDERIADIAYGLGFASPFYFSRQFHAMTDLSPRAYRKTVRKHLVTE